MDALTKNIQQKMQIFNKKCPTKKWTNIKGVCKYPAKNGTLNLD